MVSGEKALFSFLWVLLEKFGYSLISFLSTIILARLLTPVEFGLIGTVAIFISLSNMFVEGGLGAALVQKRDITAIDYSTIFIFNAGMSILIYTILYLIAPFVASYYQNEIFTDIIRVLGIVLIVNAFTLTQRVHLIRKLEFKKQTFINILSLSISIALALLMAYLDFGVWALVAQLVSYSFFVSLFMFVQVRFVPQFIFSKPAFKDLIGFGGKIILTSALHTAYNGVFGLIITKKFSVIHTGLYTQAEKLVLFPTNIFSALYDNVGFPILSKMDSPKDFQLMVSRINKGIFSIALPLLMIIPFQAENIVLIVLGDNWRGASSILAILSISLLVSLISLSSYGILKALGEGKEMLKYGLIKITIGFIVLVITMQIDFDAIMYGIVVTNVIFSILVFNKISVLTLYKWKNLKDDYFFIFIISIVINFLSKYLVHYLELDNRYLETFSYFLIVFCLTVVYFLAFKREIVQGIYIILIKKMG